MKKGFNWLLITTALLVSLIGVFTLISTEIDPSGGINFAGIVSKQIIFIIIGATVYYGMSKSDYTYFKHYQIIAVFYIVTALLLLLTLFIGPVINNTRRWLLIGGVQFQISELAKLLVVIMTAGVMSQRGKYNEWVLLLISFLLVIPIFILIYLQPHGSMSLLMFALWFFVAFTGMGEQFRNILLMAVVSFIGLGIFLVLMGNTLAWLLLSLVGVIMAIYAFYARDKWKAPFAAAVVAGFAIGLLGIFSWNNLLKDYQKERVTSFIGSCAELDDENFDRCFNVYHSRVAIGSGGVFGKGFGSGTQSRLKFLPEHQTDFIFATFAEEFGLIGSFVLLGIYVYLLYKISIIASENRKNPFAAMIAAGIGMKILLEVFINVGTNTGLTPATGIPLPLMSAGGSVTIMTFFSLGLIQSIMNASLDRVGTSKLIDKV